MPAPAASAPARSARFGGLDGLRAIAVGLVVGYHLFPVALPGGFLGVDVFFVISGFLITSLLLREHALRGTISLPAFWQRRARRLLPALAVVLLVCTSLAFAVDRDMLVGIGAQLAGAALFMSNWVFISTGSDYFTRDMPELFRNMWSLAIEEQFYLVLPLLVLLLIRLRVRRWRAGVLAALAVASAGLMAALSFAGADPTRLYFGSDTHVFGLFIGAAVAALAHRPDSADRPAAALSARHQVGLAIVAAAGLGTLGTLSLMLGEGGDASFRGGFQLATIAAIVTVWAVTRPGAWAGRVLDAPPLRWIGERSYGIYLWHWPILLVCRAALPVGSSAHAEWAAIALTLVVTLCAAATSYRYLEQPVRALGLLRAVHRAVRPRSLAFASRVIVASVAALLAVTLPVTAIAIASAPQRSSAVAAIERGQRALEAQNRPGDDPAGSGSGGTSAGSGDDTDGADGAPEPVRADGRDMTAVGDSVMLASLPELTAAFPGITVDAEVSRGLGVGVDISQRLRADGALRRVLVAGLGTNGPVSGDDLDALRRIAGDRGLVLVDAYAERDWIPGVNDELRAFADAHRGVVVADWSGAIDGVPDALAGDGIHPNPPGGEIYARTVQRAIDELETPTEAVGYALPRR